MWLLTKKSIVSVTSNLLFTKTGISCITCRVTEIEKRILNSENFPVKFTVVRFSDAIQIGSI